MSTVLCALTGQSINSLCPGTPYLSAQCSSNTATTEYCTYLSSHARCNPKLAIQLERLHHVTTLSDGNPHPLSNSVSVSALHRPSSTSIIPDHQPRRRSTLSNPSLAGDHFACRLPRFQHWLSHTPLGWRYSIVHHAGHQWAVNIPSAALGRCMCQSSSGSSSGLRQTLADIFCLLRSLAVASTMANNDDGLFVILYTPLATCGCPRPALLLVKYSRKCTRLTSWATIGATRPRA